MRVAICMSHVLLDGLQKKERLLVVYWNHGIGQKQYFGQDDRIENLSPH